jgi:hypothetical protein
VLEGILQRICGGDSYQLNMATPLEQWSKNEVPLVIRFFIERDMSAEKYVVKQPTYMESMRLVDRVWLYDGKMSEKDNSVRTIVTKQQRRTQYNSHARQGDKCGKCYSRQPEPRIKPLLLNITL